MGKEADLKKSFLDVAIEFVFKDLVSLDREKRLPRSIYLTGLDTTSLTFAAAELGCKLKRHEVYFYTQEVNGATPVNIGRHYGRALARFWYDKFKETVGYNEYVTVLGFNGSIREGFAAELRMLLKLPVYSERQFPNTRENMCIDLEKL